MADKPQLHVSMLETLSKCGIQFQRRYGARFGCWHTEEIKPPSIALITGIAVHKSVEKNLGHKIDNEGQTMTPEQVADVAATEFDGQCQGGIHYSDEEAADPKETLGNAKDQTIGLALLHNKEAAPLINPLQVEDKWVLALRGYDFDLAGQMDVVESDGIRDTKTAGKSPSKDAARSLQMGMYSMAYRVKWGVLPERVTLDYLVKNKTPVYKPVSDTPTDAWVKPLYRRIERFAEIVRSVKEGSGVFTPAAADGPSAWVCTRKWCGYADSCPFWSGR